MDFEYILAKIVSNSIGRAPNGSYAPATIRMLEENKDTLNIDGAVSNKMYLYLLFLIYRRQTKIRSIIRDGKDISKFSDEDFIDGFNTIIQNTDSWRKDDLKPFFMEFKSEIDKRPLVSANLILAGFDFIAKSTTVINNDIMFARLVDNKHSYATKTYIKYLTEDNLEYFMMTDLFSKYERVSMSLSKIRDTNLIKNNYHLYLMYCMGIEDLMDEDELATAIEVDTTETYEHILKSKMHALLEKDKSRNKLTLGVAKKFINFFKDRVLDSEYNFIKNATRDRCLRITKEYAVDNTNRSWFANTVPTGNYIVETTGWGYYHQYMMFRYAIVVTILLDLFKDDILDDVKIALDSLNKSIFICTDRNEWINKNSGLYNDICANAEKMSSHFSQDEWPYGGTYQLYRFKVEFNEPFPDPKFKIETDSNNSYYSSKIRRKERVGFMKSLVDGITSTIKSLENN